MVKRGEERHKVWVTCRFGFHVSMGEVRGAIGNVVVLSQPPLGV